VEPANLGCDQTSDHCGFQLNHTVNAWRSRTLASGSWEFVLEVLAYEPARWHALIYPMQSGTLIQMRLCSGITTSNPMALCGDAAYTAPGPAGPFTLQRTVTNVSTNNATWHCGDFHLFVDDDGTPYIISA